MPMQCYFCQTPVPVSVNDNNSTYFGTYQCLNCPQRCRVDQVYTSWKTNNTILLYAHIYVVLSNRKYHIRLHLINNYTDIALCVCANQYSDLHPYYEKDILQMPDFPLNPANAHYRLKTILTFS